MGDRVPNSDLNEIGKKAQAAAAEAGKAVDELVAKVAASQTTYNIYITAPVKTGPYIIGKTLKQYLDEYEGGVA